MGKTKRKIVRTKGGGRKVKTFSAEFANIYDPSSKTRKKVKILGVLENPANPHYIRRGIVTKGSVIKTEIGNARVTSRPSQHGTVNAVALNAEEKK